MTKQTLELDGADIGEIEVNIYLDDSGKIVSIVPIAKDVSCWMSHDVLTDIENEIRERSRRDPMTLVKAEKEESA